MSDKSTGEHDNLSHGVMDGQADDCRATTSAGPSSEMESVQQQPGATSHKERTKKPKRKKRGPLHWVPLSALPREEKLAACREAIAAGADVNGLDDSEPECHREGRPLDACFRLSHMPGNATYWDNVHVIKLLLDHGADPRLRGLWWDPASPLRVVRYQVEASEEHMQTESGWERSHAFHVQVLAMFKEAIARLEEKEEREKREKTIENGMGERGEEKSKREEENSDQKYSETS